MSVAGGASDRSARRGEILIVTGILVWAAALRALFLARWAANPLFHYPTGDEGNFHRTALGLLGLAPEPDAFLYQPLYAFYLTLTYGLLGPDPAAVRTIQLFIGVITVGLVYGLGHELGGRWVGRISALLAACYGPLVFFEGQLLAPVLTVPLTVGGLWCLLRAGRTGRGWLLLPAGVLIGLAAMARPNLLFAVPVAALWWCWRSDRWRGRLVGAGLAVLGLGLGLAPSWAHNALQDEGGVLISTAGGLTFYLGNNPQASGRFRVPPGEKIDASSHTAYRRSWQALAERAEGRRLTAGQVSAHWWRRGLEFWAEMPGRALALFGKKLLLALNRQEMPIHHPYFAVADLIPLLHWLIGFGVVFPFAAVGAWLGRGRSGTGLLVGCFGAYLLSLAVFYVADRYRVLLLPMALPLAGLGMVALARRVRRAGLRGAAGGLLVLVLAVAVSRPDFITDLQQTKGRYGLYNLMGMTEGERGRVDLAERYFRRAIQIAGAEHGATARGNLAIIMEAGGRHAEARALYLEAAALDRENRHVRRRLARLAERRGRLTEAIRWWREVAELSAEPSAARAQIERLQALRDERASPPAF